MQYNYKNKVSRTINISIEQNKYIKSKAINFSKFVRNILDKEMSEEVKNEYTRK